MVQPRICAAIPYGRCAAVLVVAPRSAVPPFEQIRIHVLELVQQGSLTPGTPLPTVRKLAADLALAPNIVARAHRELELNGVIETRGRHGSDVSTQDNPLQAQGVKAAQDLVHRIRSLGLSGAEAMALLNQELTQGSAGLV